jgi:flagellar basal-body rod modification protein FlgD
MGIETSTISRLGNTGQPAGAQGNDKLGKNEFLKILTEQLAHQDPTKPMSSEAFVAQLAQFSTLEQMQNSNDTLTKMLTMQQSSSQNEVIAMVGKDALYDSHEMELAKDGKISVVATLASSAGDVTMAVSDADGNLVRRQSFGSMKGGEHDLTWDGRSNTGALLQPGTYSVSVSATDLSGNPVPVTQQSRARITGVSFENGSAQLMIGKTSISLSDVKSIQESTTTP